MHSAPKHILSNACKRMDLDFSLDWEHFFTGMSDTGESVWMFDCPSLAYVLRVYATSEGWRYEYGTKIVEVSLV
jgi:hypothetical protein